MKLSVASFVFAFLATNAQAAPVETCGQQEGCLSVTIEQKSQTCGGAEPCTFEVCFDLNFNKEGCDKKDSGISHGCTEADSGTCLNDRATVGGNQYVDWYNSATWASSTYGLKSGIYCQTAQPGDYVHMLLKDGSLQTQCGTLVSSQVEVTSGGSGTGVMGSVYCGGTDDGLYSDVSGTLPEGFPQDAFSYTAGSGEDGVKCTGNENQGMGAECVWAVKVPDACGEDPTPPPPPSDCGSETAFAYESGWPTFISWFDTHSGSANRWGRYYYGPSQQVSNVPLIAGAGRNTGGSVAGSATFNPSTGQCQVSLNSGWTLDPDSPKVLCHFGCDMPYNVHKKTGEKIYTVAPGQYSGDALSGCADEMVYAIVHANVVPSSCRRRRGLAEESNHLRGTAN